MRISEVELREFEYGIDDLTVRDGKKTYSPGDATTATGTVFTVRTADGEEGHYRGLTFPRVMAAQVERVAADWVVGRDPLEREGIWQDLWRELRHTDHLGLAPVDVALWDLAGRHFDAPVSDLLGGYREAVPAYASTVWEDDAPDGLSDPEGYARYARECLEAGFPAFKIHPNGDPDRDIAICRAVHEAVGESMDLMLDPASRYDTYADALRVGRVLDELDFFWYEDPMADTGESIAMSRKLARDLDTPILGAEHVRTGPFGRADHLAEEALEMVRADAHLDGGITSVMKIARLAESFGLDVEPHLGGPAHLHCLSAIRNASYFEYGLVHPELDWRGDVAFEERVEVVEDGRVAVPDGPGIGVEIDWGFVEDNLTDRRIIDAG